MGIILGTTLLHTSNIIILLLVALTYSVLLTMMMFKISLLLCLATFLPLGQCIKCVVRTSVMGSNAECDAGTTTATQCTVGDACVSYYVSLTKSITRSCILGSTYVATLEAFGKSEKCTTDGCNTMKATGSANGIRISVGVVALLVLVGTLV